MKYLKMFENSDHDKKVLEGNNRIFTELDILEDFKLNLFDKGISFDGSLSNHIHVNFKGRNYILTDENESNLFISEVNKDIDIELPTFNYHISLSKESDIELIKEQLDILHKRFSDLTTCILSSETINIQIKSNKIHTNGDLVKYEKSDIDVRLSYINKKLDRYK